MAAQLLLINPKRRRRKKNARRRASSRKRHRNTRRRRVVGGHRIHRRRKKNPFARRRAHHRRRKNPMARHRRRHRNPLSLGGVKDMLIPAAIGAAGSLGLQIAWNYASPYIPAALTSNQYVAGASRIGLAVAIGMLAKKVVGSSKANAAILGAVTVELASLASFALSGTVPGLSGFGAYLQSGMGAYSSPNPAPYLQGMRGMGAYLSPRVNSVAGFGGLGLGMGGLGAMPGAMPGSMSTDNG